MVDSGVRERPFELDEDLAFLKGPGDDADPLWPLDFILQAVPVRRDGTDVVVEAGWEPWTFPGQREAITRIVADGVAAEPGARHVLEQMRQFVTLQRLFRLALDGELGLDFPLHELVELQETARSFVTIRRHERWNASPSLNLDLDPDKALLDYQGSMFEELGNIANSASVDESCRESAMAHRTLMDEGDPPEIDAEFWSGVSGVAESCRGAAARPLRQLLRELWRQDLVEEAVHRATVTRASTGPYHCEPL